MVAFTPNEWLVLALVFVAGLLLGMFLMAGGKWKRRYKEEARLRQEDRKRIAELETERERFDTERKHWEAREIAARARSDGPPPAA